MASNHGRAHQSVLIKARRAEAIDADEIVKYVDRKTMDLFGPNTREVGKITEIM